MKKSLLGFTALVLIVTGLFTACKKKDEATPDTANGKYYLNINPGGGATAVTHVVPDLTSGEYSIANAKETTPVGDLIKVNGSVYGLSNKQYHKYTLSTSGALTEVALTSMKITSRVANSLFDIGNNQLLSIFGGIYMFADRTDDRRLRFEVLDATTLAIVRTDSSISVPYAANKYWSNYGVYVKEGKIYIGWAYNDQTSYLADDSVTCFVLDRNTFTLDKIISDTRTSCLSVDRVQSAFLHTDGALYFSTCNNDYWGFNEGKPAGLLRIKAGETDFDDDYFFNITAAVGGYFNQRLFPVGGGKAITKVFRKDLVASYDDYSNGYVVENWLVDVVNKTAKKLDIPLSKGAIWNEFITLENNKFAILANTSTGNYFYIYDTATGTISKGAKYIGGTINSATAF